MEMANLRKDETNLPVNVWLDESGKDRPVKHNSPRIKVQINKRSSTNVRMMYPVSICDEPDFLISPKGDKDFDLTTKDLQKIARWIILNKDLLLRHWNKEIGIATFVVEMKKV